MRKAINLVTSVKMPFSENLSRNRAKKDRVWHDREGATTGCIRLDDRRWCYEHVPPWATVRRCYASATNFARRVRGALYYYVVHYDLDVLIEVGSTTQIGGPDRRPIAHVTEFYSRSTKRGNNFWPTSKNV
jgi:hypothetical protein